MTFFSRRDFVNSVAATSLAAGTAGLPLSKAAAATTNGYKALVCIFLYGGIDHADTVLPTDEADYNELVARREELILDAHGAGPSARTRSNLLHLAPDNPGSVNGRSLALAPDLTDLHDMFRAGDLAILGGVGPLLQPTDRTLFRSSLRDVPKRLFSHNDQQSTWLALAPEGERFGWGGRFSDSAAAGGVSNAFSTISFAGTSVFASGQNTRPFLTDPGRPGTIRVLSDFNILGRGGESDQARERLSRSFLQNDFQSDFVLERDLTAGNVRGLENVNRYTEALDSLQEQFFTSFPETPTGEQLAAVASAIAIRGTLNVDRQVFFTGRGGLDTHSGQATDLPRIQRELSEAMAAFKDAMVQLGLWNDVTVFTASDFGRRFNNNGDGTDHGWGGHHFIAGGSVAGRRFYGEFARPPAFDPDRYTSDTGALIPAVSVEQYGATLGSWFGLSPAELRTVFPRLENFTETNLGFLL